MSHLYPISVVGAQLAQGIALIFTEETSSGNTQHVVSLSLYTLPYGLSECQRKPLSHRPFRVYWAFPARTVAAYE